MIELSLSPLTISRAAIAPGQLRLSVRTIYRMLNGEPVSSEKREALARHLNLSVAELEGSQPVPFFDPDRSPRQSPLAAPPSVAQDLGPVSPGSGLALFMRKSGHLSVGAIIQRYTQRLVSIQNPDGGWGSEEGVSSSPLNTAEVLLALRHEVRSDPTPLRRGLEFLRDSQDSGGGWHCRRQFPGENLTVTATALCIQALQAYESFNSTVSDSEIPKAFSWLLTVIRDGLWPNAPGTRPSVPATACALQAFALAFQSRFPCEQAVLRASVRRLEAIQCPDGGFPFTPGQPSSIGASLQVMHALVLLPQEELLDDDGMLRRIRAFVAGAPPHVVVQTELQENDVIDGRGLQFEHFNASWLLLVSQHRRVFSDALLQMSLDHIASIMRSDGCPAIPGGRIYSWSTAHCLRALLAFHHA